VTEAETCSRELSHQHGHTENAIPPPDSKTRLPSTRQQEKAESTLPAPPASDTRHHEGRSNPLNEPPILAACRHNRIAWLRKLLAADPTLAYRAAPSGMAGERWVSPLCVAAHHGRVECIKALLSIPGIRVNEKKDGWTPLCLAAHYGHAECIKALLSAPDIRVNEKNNSGWTPLILAVRHGHAECAKALLSVPGILVNEKNNDDWTPLCAAARYGHTECVKALLSAPDTLVNEKNNKGHGALMLAAHFGHAQCARALLSAPGIRVNRHDDPVTPLHCAAREGQIECVQALLNAPGIRVNEKDYNSWTPLDCAARNNQKECLKLLIASKEVNITLLNAAREGQAKVLAEILNTLNTLQEPAKTEVIIWVLNMVDRDGKTLLCQAAQFGHQNIVALFLAALKGLPQENKSGATMAVLSATDRLGRTPLYMAAAHGHDKIITQLLVALHRLAKTEEPRAIAALVNAADLFGETPVSQARSLGHFRIESLLTRAFPSNVYTAEATRDAHSAAVPFNKALLRLDTLPKAVRLNVVTAVLYHAREDVLLALNVTALESYHPLVAEILAGLKRLPESPEDVSRNHAILKVMDCLCEDGDIEFSHTCVASEGQEQVAKLMQAFPILSAARNGQTAIVTRILKILETWPESARCQAIRTVMTVSNNDWGAGLLVANQRNQWEVVAHLLNTPDRISEYQRTDAIPAVMHAVNAHGVTPLHWAAYKGHHEVVRQLLHAVDRLPETERLEIFTAMVKAVDPNGVTALYWAAFEGHDKVVEQFLNTVDDFPEAERMAVFEAMADTLDTLKISPLSAAIDNDHKKIVHQLIQAFPLTNAVLDGQRKSVEQFIQALQALPWAARCSALMATLEKTWSDGATPLYIAASQGCVETIKLLLGTVSMFLGDEKHKEAKPKPDGNPGSTALQDCNDCGFAEESTASNWTRYREVLYCTCRLEEEDGIMEISPLGIAARNRHVEAVTLLLEATRQLFSTT